MARAEERGERDPPEREVAGPPRDESPRLPNGDDAGGTLPPGRTSPVPSAGCDAVDEATTPLPGRNSPALARPRAPAGAPRPGPARKIAPEDQRAWVRLPSGRRLDLLSPTPLDWTDEDLAIGLARTFRWGGHSIWPGAPLSVAQHSLAVLELRRAKTRGGLPEAEARRELLHDAEEGLLGFDCISPLKPFLGAGFAALQERLSTAVARRYALPAWTPESKRAHKACDIALAAAEAVHVAGWTPAEVRGTLGIRAAVMQEDPLAPLYGEAPWRPWPPELAAERFLAALARLGEGRGTGR